jgi:hypothetical protein
VIAARSCRRGRLLATVFALCALPLLATACGGTSAVETSAEPAVTEQVPGTDIIRVKLTAAAAERLGVKTVPVRSDPRSSRATIPYAAVLYDPDGSTWTYASPARLVFQRKDITVARIDGDEAVLVKGPRVGAVVVSAGATEIWGVEYGGIEED